MMDDARRIELEREDAARRAIEDAAGFLEGYSTNALYQKAFRLAASLLRGKKSFPNVK